MPVSPIRIFQKPPDDQIGSTVAFTPSGTLLFAAKNQVVEANVLTGRLGRTFTAAKAPIACFALASASHHLAALANDGAIYRWDTATGRPLHIIPLRDRNHDKADYEDCDLAISPNGRYLAVRIGPYGFIRLYDTPAGRMLKSFDVLSTAAFSPDSKTLFLGGPQRLQAWDVTTLRPRRLQRLGDDLTDPVFPMIDCSPDGRWLAAGMNSGRPRDSVLAVIDARSLRESWNIDVGCSQDSPNSVSKVVYAPSGHRIAIGIYCPEDSDRQMPTLSLWNARDGKAAGNYPVTKTVRSIAFSRGEKQIAALTDCVTIWPVISAAPSSNPPSASIFRVGG